MKICEFVILNYKRPDNVALIVRAAKNQTVPCTVTICDFSPSPEFRLSKETILLADKYIRCNKNYGPSNRYIPLLAYRHKYTYFTDDDILPGRDAIANFINYAEKLKSFGVLGQIGRQFNNKRINTIPIIAKDKHLEVDIVVNGYFVKTENLKHVYEFLWKTKFDPLLSRQDDFLLSLSMKSAGKKVYIIPALNEEDKQDKRKLSEEYALWKMPDHLKTRQEIIDKYFR